MITRTITLDKTAPTGGTITINNGAASTATTSVTLQVTPPSDSGSGVAYMAFSNTSTPVPTTWIPVATTASWVLDATAGTRTVYAWFKDGSRQSLGDAERHLGHDRPGYDAAVRVRSPRSRARPPAR